MSAEYSVESLQHLILSQHASTSVEAIAALRAFQERIKADEGAVPDVVAIMSHLPDNRAATRDEMFRALRLAEQTRPPAQAEQVDDAITDYYTGRNRGGWAAPRNKTASEEAAEPAAHAIQIGAGRYIVACPSTAEPAAQGEVVAGAPSIEAAEAIGAKGGPAVEAERLAFEAWMKGHCWTLGATWRDGAYRSDAEQGGKLCPHAMQTRGLWAAWRDRSALAAQPRAVPDGWQPMETAPRDGSMLRLLVQFEDHATDDTTGPAPTIGAYCETAECWQFAGWCWTHDHFTEGKGTPVGWLPMLAAAPSPGESE